MYYYDPDGMPISVGRWIALFEDTAARVVASTVVGLPGGGTAQVSTVWLGLDHNYSGTGPPLIFETMVFFEAGRYDSDDWCARSSTREEALAAHQEGVAWAESLGLLGERQDADNREQQ